MKGGHTYKVDISRIPDTKEVDFKFTDLGKETKCHFEQYHKVNGNAHLICTKK